MRTTNLKLLLTQPKFSAIHEVTVNVFNSINECSCETEDCTLNELKGFCNLCNKVSNLIIDLCKEFKGQIILDECAAVNVLYHIMRNKATFDYLEK